MPGSITSSTTRSGRNSSAFISADGPSPTTSVTKPSAVNRSASAAAIVASSSTTKIRWATPSMYGATDAGGP